MLNFTHVCSNFYIVAWCGHCKSLEPEYAKAATILREQKPNVRLAKVDATIETILAEKFQIEGYPTLKLIINGSVHEYQGGREASEIVEYLIKRTGTFFNKLM